MIELTHPTPESSRAAEDALRSLSGHVGAVSLRVREDGYETTIDLPQEVMSVDLLAYKARFESEQDMALAELTAEAQRLGLGY